MKQYPLHISKADGSGESVFYIPDSAISSVVVQQPSSGGGSGGIDSVSNRGDRWYNLADWYITENGVDVHVEPNKPGKAEQNSRVFAALINYLDNLTTTQGSNQRATLYIPTGDWYFSDGWNLRPKNILNVIGDSSPDHSYSSTMLSFTGLTEPTDSNPYANAGIALQSGTVKNIWISGGTDRYYGITVFRDNTSTTTISNETGGVCTSFTDVLTKNNRNYMVLEHSTPTVATERIGVYAIDHGNVWIENVKSSHFHVGFRIMTGNNTIYMCEADHCKVGYAIKNDVYVTGCKAATCYDGAAVEGTLAHFTDFRGDSIGRHLVNVWKGDCWIQGIDGDYVVGSLIHYGHPSYTNNADQKFISIGSATGITGRIATKNCYGTSADQRFNYDMTAQTYDDTSACSFISFEPGTNWSDGVFEFVKGKPTSCIDGNRSSYFCPNSEMCIPAGTAVTNVTITTCNNSLEGATADTINKKIVNVRNTTSVVNGKLAEFTIITGDGVKKVTKTTSGTTVADAFTGGSSTGSAAPVEKKYRHITTYTLSSAGKPKIDIDPVTSIKVSIHLPNASTTENYVYVYLNCVNSSGAHRVVNGYSNKYTAAGNNIGMIMAAWLEHGQWMSIHSSITQNGNLRTATLGVPGYLSLLYMDDNGTESRPYINQIEVPTASADFPAGTEFIVYGVDL